MESRALLAVALAGFANVSLAPAAVIVNGGAWPNPELRACWTPYGAELATGELLSAGQRQHFSASATATDPVVENAAARLREIVDREFTVEATVASFTALEPCLPPLTRERYDVVVVIGRGNASPLVSGEASDAGRNPARALPASVALAIPTAFGAELSEARWRAVETTGLHELAHVLGLHEERSHPGIAQDAYRGPHEPRANVAPVSTFDPNSIMLYEFVFAALEPARFPREAALLRRVDPDRFVPAEDGAFEYLPGLSRGDRHGLRCLYDPEMPKDQCVPTFDPYATDGC